MDWRMECGAQILHPWAALRVSSNFRRNQLHFCDAVDAIKVRQIGQMVTFH